MKPWDVGIDQSIDFMDIIGMSVGPEKDMSMRKTPWLVLNSPYECFHRPEEASGLALFHYKFEAASENDRDHGFIRVRPCSPFEGVIIWPVRIHSKRQKEGWGADPC
jgi:hypothetical protein